jgi:dynein assembly factor 1
VLDLSHNKLDDPDILGVFEQMPNLSVLNLMGNDAVREIRNYRKTLTARIPSLKYLDDRPVFEDDRRIAEAWARGGRDAETAEREAIKQEKRDKERRNSEAFRRMQEEAREKRQRELLEGAVREPWEGEEGETSEDELVTEDDFAPDGETTGGKAQKEGEFKMKIIEIEDADESDDDEEEDDSAAAKSTPAVSAAAGKAEKIVIEEMSDEEEDEEEAAVAAAPAPAPAVARVQIEESDDESEEDPDDLDELD